MVYWYFTSPNIKRNIPYGVRGRNLVDIYLPTQPPPRNSKVPVAILVWGGAWVIGYKGWSALVAKYLSENGVLVFTPDYRNFPQGDVRDMLQDIDTAMNWMFKNCGRYGGDVNEISLICQSAGAHLCAMSLLRQAVDEQVSLKWSISRVKHFVGISGVYNVVDNVMEFDKRGLPCGIYNILMAGDYAAYSPYHYILKHVDANTDLRSRGFPPVTLIHGTCDKTSDCSGSTQFASALQQCQVPVTTHVLDGKTHTDMFLEDQLMGIGDSVNQFLLSIVNPKAKAAINDIYVKSTSGKVWLPMRCLLLVAQFVNPF